VESLGKKQVAQLAEADSTEVEEKVLALKKVILETGYIVYNK